MTDAPKPKRHRRTKLEMQAARAAAEHERFLADADEAIMARLASATPQQISSAEKTIRYWARQARRY